MKMMSMKMMAIVAGIGYLGYMYFKSNPDKLKKMEEIGLKTSKEITNTLTEK